jgi:hypothetical protein
LLCVCVCVCVSAYANSMLRETAPQALQDLYTSWSIVSKDASDAEPNACPKPRRIVFDMFDEFHVRPEFNIIYEPPALSSSSHNHNQNHNTADGTTVQDEVAWVSLEPNSYRKRVAPSSLQFNDTLVYTITLRNVKLGATVVTDACHWYRIYHPLDRPPRTDFYFTKQTTEKTVAKAFYLHWATGSYYHWLVECLPRLLELDKQFGSSYSILAVKSSFVEQTLTLLGFDLARVVWIEPEVHYRIGTMQGM